ncbi:hypothetical protein A0H76_2214 [Hepatospora eriocheir]|uniref:Uncharacterized protein n=1 Tax=Hepatospora eriocheir TaxID=1081669 RepID=A0A1X0QFS2_9MICR|nr:hypothetical protein A0H76_2214 [Hepatospora eriocheir]
MKFFKLIRFVVGSDLEEADDKLETTNVNDSKDNESSNNDSSDIKSKSLIKKELIKQNPILEKDEIDLNNQRTVITDQKLKKRRRNFTVKKTTERFRK